MHIKEFKDYLELEKGYSKHTVLAYQKDVQELHKFLKGQHDNVSDSEIEYSLIRDWVINLSENGLDNRSINRKMSSLKTYFSFLRQAGICEKDPMQNHKSLNVAKKVQVPFTKDDVDNVIKLIYAKHQEKDSLQSLKIKKIYSEAL